jgi:outer membrane lipase/esterase
MRERDFMLRRNTVKGVLLALAIASPAMATGDGFTNMYVLGDSLSDQGNVFHATEYLLGIGIPTSEHYWQGRFADGEVWTGVLANRVGISLEPSLFKDGTFDYDCVADGSDCGTNFADGGARTDYNRIEFDYTKPHPVPYLGHGGLLPKDEFPWTLDTQRQAFASRGTTGPDALYVVFAGANDITDLISMWVGCNIYGAPVLCEGRGNKEDPEYAIPVVINGISDAIATFVAAGARDILVPNMPNMGVIPAIPPELSALATTLSTQYNEAFNTMLAQWEGRVNIIPFDTFDLITKVVQDPEAAGFSNATDACYSGFVGPDETGEECLNPDAYVFWDREHPTAAFHAYLAEQFLATIVLDILDDLSQQVSGLDIKDKVRNGLIKKLDDASHKFAEGKDTDAVSKLEDFIETVEGKQGKEIMEEDALSLIKRAEQVIALLES